MLQDEADLSQKVLGPTYPDSGTAGRLNSGNLARDLIGGIASLPLELAFSPKVATKTLKAASKLKTSTLGKNAGDIAPQGVPAATRALLGPSSDPNEEPGKALMESHARGGLMQYAAGGDVSEGGQALGGGALASQANRQQARSFGRGNTPVRLQSWGSHVPKYDEGGQVGYAPPDPASLVGQDHPDGPRIPQLWDQYTSYLDKNISQGRRDMENGYNYSKEKGLYVKDPEALKRTVENMNLAGTFVGPSSKLWKATHADEFLKREGKEAAEALWQKFGTGRDAAGNLKQEISDHLANLNANVLKRAPTAANKVLEHPELFESYPELANTQMSLMTGNSTGGQAYNMTDRLTGRTTPYIDINRNYYQSRFPTSSQDKLNSTSLHEFQHLVQKLEGTPGGGSPSREGAEMAKKLGIKAPKETQMHRDFLQQIIETAKQEGVSGGQLARLEEKLKDANKPVVNDAAKRKAYERLYGEAESRLTERRRMLNPEQRAANFPFKHSESYPYGYDVPADELITGGYRGLPEMSAYPAAKKARGGLLSLMSKKH